MANNYGSLEGTMDANGILGGEIQFNGAGGRVKDVQVNDVSVVDANGIAKIDLTDYAKTEDIPADLADLQDDADHRTVTDTEKTEWSGKSNVSANPSTTTETLTGIEIDGTAYAIPSGSGDVTDVKVNDTSVVDAHGVANIDLTGYAEKTDLGTASALDVASSGDASTSQVVKGDDTRLTDARPASDVSSWAKASTKPDYTASEVGAIATTAKGTANGVAELDENGKVPSAQLPSYVDDVLEYASVSVFPATGESGKIYIALDTNKTYRWSGTTYTEISESLALGETDSTAYAGNKGKQNADNIAAIQGLIPSSATTSNKLATASDIPDISGKADKSEMSVSTSGDQTTIQLKNGTSATVLNAHQSITGKADKVTNATENNFAALDANGNLKDSGHKHSDYLTQHQDISGKADKVSGATNGNLAGLDANGNLTDSGIAKTDIGQNAVIVEGIPISFTTVAEQLAKSTIITLNPVQSGSGTPSSSNIRPFVGRTSVAIFGSGKNLMFGISQGSRQASDGSPTSAGNRLRSTEIIPLKGGATYTLKATTSTSGKTIRFTYNYWTNRNNSSNPRLYDSGWQTLTNDTFTITPTDDVNCGFIFAYTDDSGLNPSALTVQFEFGSQPTNYIEPFKNMDFSIALGRTVYGATLNVEKGELIIDTARIASYAGETLPGKWWSDRDVYVEGTSPSTGAEVVYKTATSTVVSITAYMLVLLAGYNYLSTSGDLINLTYMDGKLCTSEDLVRLYQFFINR